MRKLTPTLALLLASSPAAAQKATVDDVMSSLKLKTSLAAINARTSCATPAHLRDPNTIVVCGRRETSRYRYGQRGQPYSAKFRGMTPQQVANALSGIDMYQPSAGERAYNGFQAAKRDQQMHLGVPGGLAAITDPFNAGFGATRKSRDLFWGIQQTDDD
jgi:hypothetical protein